MVEPVLYLLYENQTRIIEIDESVPQKICGFRFGNLKARGLPGPKKSHGPRRRRGRALDGLRRWGFHRLRGEAFGLGGGTLRWGRRQTSEGTGTLEHNWDHLPCHRRRLRTVSKKYLLKYKKNHLQMGVEIGGKANLRKTKPLYQRTFFAVQISWNPFQQAANI